MQGHVKTNTGQANIRALMTAGFEALPLAALMYLPDENLTVLWRNSAHAAMSESVGRDVSGKGMFDAFPPSDEANAAEAMAYVHEATSDVMRSGAPREVGPTRFDLPDAHGNYIEHYWTMHFTPIRRDGQIVAILQTAQNVTEKTLTELMAQSHRRAAASTASIAYFSYDPETDLFDRSEAIDQMFGFAPGEAGQNATPFFDRVHPDDVVAVHAEVARVMAAPAGEVASFDYRVPMPDGTERFIRIRGEFATDPVDRRRKLVGTFVDLTDMETARRDLERAAAASEALVVEANHRIKNSLQVALSLVRLQSSKLASENGEAVEIARDALRGVEARVRAVANVHAAIQIDRNVAEIDLVTMLDGLVQSTRQSAELTGDAMVFAHPATSVTLKSDRAIALSLMVNELLTNAIKHGDPGPARPVSVWLKDGPDNATTITVGNASSADTARMDIESSGTGVRLIEQFGAQIGAEVTRTQDGARYETRITLPHPA